MECVHDQWCTGSVDCWSLIVQYCVSDLLQHIAPSPVSDSANTHVTLINSTYIIVIEIFINSSVMIHQHQQPSTTILPLPPPTPKATEHQRHTRPHTRPYYNGTEGAKCVKKNFLQKIICSQQALQWLNLSVSHMYIFGHVSVHILSSVFVPQNQRTDWHSEEFKLMLSLTSDLLTSNNMGYQDLSRTIYLPSLQCWVWYM